jgi:hypothetical protein
MRGRNLKLLFHDDRPQVDWAPKELIDQVNVTPYWWERHCRDLSRHKAIDFDLLSADINYSEDNTDPEKQLKANSWGLLHAVMALARRRDDDTRGNHLPLAWEVRTVSPGAYRTDPAATRVYGLLRSFAAQPDQDESLEDCIHREYGQDHPAQDNPIPLGRGELADVFVEDLAHQPSRGTNPSDALARLLPQWRRLFWRAVDSGEVALSIDHLQQMIAALKQTSGALPAFTEESPTIGIAMSGGGAYGINLLSIMADLVDGDALDVRSENNSIAIFENGKKRAGSVVEWCEWIQETATGKRTTQQPSERLRNIAIRYTDQIQTAWIQKGALQNVKGDLQSVIDSTARSEHDRGLLFVILITHSCLYGRDFTTQEKLAVDYGYAHHPHLFRRPLLNNRSMFGEISRPSTFAKALLSALKNERHQLSDNWTWMRRGLRDWYEERLQGEVYRDIAMKRAPGLFAS